MQKLSSMRAAVVCAAILFAVGAAPIRAAGNWSSQGPPPVRSAPQREDPNRSYTLRADESADASNQGGKKLQAWGRPVDVLVMPDGGDLAVPAAAVRPRRRPEGTTRAHGCGACTLSRCLGAARHR